MPAISSAKNKLGRRNLPRIVYAGDRDIAVWVLEFLIKRGVKPLALLVSDKERATHAKQLVKLCGHLDRSRVLKGTQFREKDGIDLLNRLEPDYIISVHAPYIFPEECLRIPKLGILNLHPAYLPHNRGWHTPTWAIWDETPYGATLHLMDKTIDTGAIVYHKRMEILPTDTADTLYARVKKLEFEMFKEAWPLIVSKNYVRKPQPKGGGTIHKKRDIEKLQHIDLGAKVKAGDLIRRLRALTTDRIEEAAYFEVKGKKYRVQIRVVEEKPGKRSKTSKHR
jgi:methionyl-tRNA formyltransferase